MTAKNRPKRHHYLPIHYQKGFADSSKKLYIYDKVADRIITNADPKAFFAQNDLNTIRINGEPNDFIEATVFDRLDDHSATQFQKIRATNWTEPDAISAFDRIGFAWTLCNLFWRIPKSDDHLKSLLDQGIEPEPTESETNTKKNEAMKSKMIEFAGKHKDLQKLYKLSYPLHSFYAGEVKNIAHHWYVLHLLHGNTVITGDNPFARKREVLQAGNLLGEFIFPISKDKLLFITSERPKFIETHLVLYLNLQILHQSERFICGDNRQLIEMTSGIYKDFVKAGIHDNIRQNLFDRLAEINQFESIVHFQETHPN